MKKDKLQMTLQKYSDYYEQLYANKMDKLEEMDRFLQMYNILRVNQEEIENMNRPIISTDIKNVIKKFPKTSKRQKPRT